jgi:hypothetical protein
MTEIRSEADIQCSAEKIFEVTPMRQGFGSDIP